MGYHDKALVESDHVGENTNVWAFAHILPGAIIGNNCNICDHVFIENDVSIGNNVTIKCGVQLWDGIIIEDNVFIGPNATFTNDLYPKSKVYPEKFLKTHVCKGSSIGANATILPGLTIGKDALVGAGSVVTKDVPPKAIVKGNPAYISGYVDSPTFKEPDFYSVKSTDTPVSIQTCRVAGVKIHKLPIISDIRGSLTFAEYGQLLPFEVKRYFIVYDVPSRKIRGEHAHKALHQFLVCIKGSCSLVVDDGKSREEILLNDPSIGVHIPSMIWGIQYKYSRDAMLLVFASDIYKEEDYIRDYDDFISCVRSI